MITSQEEAFAILAKHGIKPPVEAVYQNSLEGMPIQQFMATQCYLEKNLVMPCYEHVDLLFDLMFYPEKYGLPHFFTILYSTIKKSIKTTLSGIVDRWVGETWPGQQECICLASDADQAKGRGYEAFKQTIEKHPRYSKEKRTLYGPQGQVLWRVTEKQGEYYPDGSIVKPVSTDYAGEAGANPTVISITELWTWRLEKHKRFYAEMTIPPTRPRGFRFIDSYAGYRGESNVLWDVWQRLQDADRVKQIKADSEIGVLWNQAITKMALRLGLPLPDKEDPPIYIDLPSRTFGYIDQGLAARRFAWQLGEQGDTYYLQEENAEASHGDFLRLHFNEWAEPVEALMPIQWWDNCTDKTMRPLNPREAVVIGVDASLNHDCTAMSMISRHPNIHHESALRDLAVWDPKNVGEINFDRTILPTLVDWHKRQNIIELTYDKYQLSYLMSRIATGKCGDITMPDGSIERLPALPVREFNQQGERREADSTFVHMVRDRQFHHDGTFAVMRDHLLQAAGRLDTHENTKLHIEKRDTDSKIDAVVATAMANKRCLHYGI